MKTTDGKTYLSEQDILDRIAKFDIPGKKAWCVPKGGIQAGKYFKEVEVTYALAEADFIFDDIIDSGKTREHHKYLHPGLPFVALVDKTGEDKDLGWVVFPWEGTPEDGIKDNIVRVLQYLGEDVKREGLIDTPKRVVKSWDRLYGGYKQEPKDILKVFKDGACDQMVLLKDIEMYSTCEHHMLPFYGKAHIAYIPNGKVIGISKLARLLEIYSRRLQIQERIGQQVTQALDTHLKAIGSACIIEAQHFCMTSRGVEKQNSIMVTSSLTGAFRKDNNARNELIRLIK